MLERWRRLDLIKVSPIVLSALSLCVAIGSLAVASLGYFINRNNTDQLNHRFFVLGNLYLQSRAVGDSLEVTPSDGDKHILNFVVQYPAGAFQRGAFSMEGTMGGGRINFDPGLQSYMLKRFAFYTGEKPPFAMDDIRRGFVPIIIYTTYTYAGEQRLDRSVYLLTYYVVSVNQIKTFAQPSDITYCGRLQQDDPKIDFLADPWMPMALGELKKPSISVLANCAPPMMGSSKMPTARTTLIWLSLPPGQFEIISNLSEHKSEPRGKSTPRGLMIDASQFRVRSLAGKPNSISYWFSFYDN